MIERLFFILVIFVKIPIIVSVGPLLQPDSGSYISFSEMMLGSWDWAVNQPNTFSVDAFRTIGYPMILSFAKLLFGDYWDYAVISFQVVVGGVASTILLSFCRKFFRNEWQALIVAGGYSFSSVVYFELHILTDALYAHLIVIVLAMLGEGVVKQRGPQIILIAGILFALAFLVRDFTLYLTPVFVPVVVLAAWQHHANAPLVVGRILLFVMPTIILFLGLHSWNHARTGTAFVTTAARTAALLPLVELEGRGVPVFDGDSVLDKSANAALRTYTFTEVLTINNVLAAQGVSGVELSSLVRERLIETMLEHPVSFAARALSQFRLDRRTKHLANPSLAVREILAVGSGAPPPGLSNWVSTAWKSASPISIFAAAVEILVVVGLAMISIGAWIAFPVWYLYRIVRPSNDTPGYHLLGGFWLSYVGTITIYSLINLEDRYIMGLAPFMMIVGMSMIDRALQATALRFRRNRISA